MQKMFLEKVINDIFGFGGHYGYENIKTHKIYLRKIFHEQVKK